MERKLTTILEADVVGYGRLMGEDEAGTLEALKSLRQEIIKPKQLQYHGRTVKLMGDGALMEFASVVDAVSFAVEVQIAMREHNAEVPENRQIVYRIGINIGDIIVEGDDIYGDGVNVAARIEGLAEPGGICVVRAVRNQVRDKLDLDFEDLGEIEVKNISRPAHVFAVVLNDKAEALQTPILTAKAQSSRQRWPLLIAAVAALILIPGGLLWSYFQSDGEAPSKISQTADAITDKPSIVVLPFDNFSDDTTQEYFAHGITEDITTDLSRFDGLFVIARNSAFFYEDKAIDPTQVSRELGVRYVLEGSVRRVGELLRINAQLIDGNTGNHLWANRFDGAVDDVLTFQDDVIKSIVSALSLKLNADQENQLLNPGTTNPKAYDAFLQGWAHYIRRTPADYAEAVKHFKRAIALDADYSLAYAALASTYWEGWERWWYKQLGFDEWIEPRRQAEKYLEIALRKPTALAHQVASEVRRQQRKHKDMIREAEAAVQLDPNDPNSYIALSWAFAFNGYGEDALAAIDRAMVLDPHYPAFYLYVKGFAYFSLERYEQAAEFLERALDRNPALFTPNIILISTYAHLGRIDAAKERLAEHPTPLNIEWIKYYWPYRRPTDIARLVDGLRQAGVPEGSPNRPPPKDW